MQNNSSLYLQVSVSTGTKKLVAAAAFGAVSLFLLARRFQRRKGRKKGLSAQWQQPAAFEFPSTDSVEKGNSIYIFAIKLVTGVM